MHLLKIIEFYGVPQQKSSERWVALTLFADQSEPQDLVHLEPRVTHLSEKTDPFSENETYSGTLVSCKIQMILINSSNKDIAAKTFFGDTNAPITANFIFQDGLSHYMQGNFGLTGVWSNFKESPIFKANATDLLKLESLKPYKFKSKEKAQEFIDAG